MNGDGKRIRLTVRSWFGPKNTAVKSFHNKGNDHKNNGVGYARSMDMTLNESVSSGTSAHFIMLCNVLDTEEGTSDKIQPSTNKIVNDALENPSRTNITNNLKTEKITKNMMKVETNNKANHVDVKRSSLSWAKLTSNEVKRRLGFSDMFQALSYAEVAYIGNM